MNRIRITGTSLEISKPGFDVLTCGKRDMAFSSKAQSLPILTKIGPVHVTAGMGVATVIAYGKTFAKTPVSALFWSPTEPTSTSKFYMFSGIQSSPDVLSFWDYATNQNGQPTVQVSVHVRRFVDRIEITAIQYGDAAVPLNSFSGYVCAVIFDYS